MTESRLMVVSGCRKSWGKKGYEVSFGGDKNVSKFIILLIVLLCEYTKKTLNCTF